MIYIGVEVQNTIATEEVRTLNGKRPGTNGSSFVVLSNIRKIYIKPY